MRASKTLIILILTLILSACVDGETYAPVTDLSHIEEIPRTGIHKVVAGETLYEIAWRYGLDYRYLAERNNIHAPYTIFSGQLIQLQGRKASIKPSPLIKVPVVKEPNYSTKGWICPAQGQIIRAYSPSNRGINIAGKAGQPIYAAASGKVVYSGKGLRGYGNLIIIKHNTLYLSAYAHNRQILVRENDWVRKGQKIAEMGDTGADSVMLHFEIRRAGKPINPLMMSTC